MGDRLGGATGVEALLTLSVTLSRYAATNRRIKKNQTRKQHYLVAHTQAQIFK
jgi:hypothetical protein